MHQVKAHEPKEEKQLIQAPKQLFFLVNSQIEGFHGTSTYVFSISCKKIKLPMKVKLTLTNISGKELFGLCFRQNML